jgi:hypothetical protein
MFSDREHKVCGDCYLLSTALQVSILGLRAQRKLGSCTLSCNVRGASDTSGMNKVHWTFEAHEDFDLPSFLKSLTGTQRLTLSVFLTAVSEYEALTEAPRSWIKPLGEGLFEFRIRDPELLLRLFFTYRRGHIILLLAGYDKGEDPSNKRQQREIDIARKRLKVG